MDRVRSDLFARTAAFGTAEQLTVIAEIQAPDPDTDALGVEADIDDSAGTMAYGAGIEAQVVGMSVYVNGAIVPPASVVSISVSRNANEFLQRWSFEVELPSGSGIFGVNPIESRTPSLRLGTVNIYGSYLTETGLHTIALITGGVADSESRSWSEAGLRATFTGVDRGGRYDGETFNLVLPPGHGFTRERVAELCALSVGFSNSDISFSGSGVTMMKEFQAVDAQMFPMVQELADVEGRRVILNRSGDLVWIRMGDPSADLTNFTFDTRHVSAGSVRISQSGDVITCVEAKGEEQKPSIEGDVTKTQTTSIFSENFPENLPFRQKLDGSFESIAPAEVPLEPILTRYTVYDRITRNGALIYERTRVSEYFNPEAERYRWDNGTYEWEPVPYDVYVSVDAMDSNPAFVNEAPTWRLVGDDEVWHYWFTLAETLPNPTQSPSIDNGLFVPYVSTIGNFQYPIGFGPYNDNLEAIEGIKIGVFRRSKRFYAKKLYLKTRVYSGTPPYQTWEEVTPAHHTQISGSGEVFDNESQEFQIVSEERTHYEVDDKGYLLGTVTHRYGYWKPPGLLYLYGDNTESADPAETYRYIGSTMESFIGTGESSHDRVIETHNQYGNSIGSVKDTGLEGYLPAAERIPDSSRTASGDLLSEEEIDAAFRRSLRTASHSISVVARDEELEDDHSPRTVQLQAPYAENEDELESMAWATIDGSACAKVSFQLAGANFYVEPGMKVRLDIDPMGLDHDVRVVSVSWSYSGGVILTDVSGEIYAR